MRLHGKRCANKQYEETCLKESKVHHEKLENEIWEMLDRFDSEEKEPSAMAKSMSWMKTNVKLSMDNSDDTVADLITDGCNMGIKSLNRYLNQYEGAENSAKKTCKELISIEEQLCEDLKMLSVAVE